MDYSRIYLIRLCFLFQSFQMSKCFRQLGHCKGFPAKFHNSFNKSSACNLYLVTAQLRINNNILPSTSAFLLVAWNIGAADVLQHSHPSCIPLLINRHLILLLHDQVIFLLNFEIDISRCSITRTLFVGVFL